MRWRTPAAAIVAGLCVAGAVAWTASGDELPDFIRFGARRESDGFCAVISMVRDESCEGLCVDPFDWKPDGGSPLTVRVAPERSAIVSWIRRHFVTRWDGEVYVRLRGQARPDEPMVASYVRTGLSAAAGPAGLPDAQALLECARAHVGADRFDALVRSED